MSVDDLLPEPLPLPRGGRRAWLAVAAIAVALQVFGFWVVSPSDRSVSEPSRPVAPRQAFLDSVPAGATAETWLWLLSPSVLLEPSELDFSGAAWMEATPLRVEIESFAVPQRPLPYESSLSVPGAERRAGVGSASEPARLDPGPGSQWELPEGRPALPIAPPVPLLVGTRLRVVSGFAGWQLTGPTEFPARPEASAGGAVRVRLALAGDGEPATPPTLWESSGVAVLDEAALAIAADLRWRRSGASPQQPGAPLAGLGGESGWTWGMVEVEWGAGQAVTPSPRTP